MVPPFQETSIPSVSPCGCSPCVPISRNTRLCQVTKLSQTNNLILPSSPKRHLSHLDMRNHSSRERSVGFLIKGTISRSMCFCIAFTMTLKRYSKPCYSVSWPWGDRRLGPSCGKAKKNISTLVHVGSTTYPITSNLVEMDGNGVNPMPQISTCWWFMPMHFW